MEFCVVSVIIKGHHLTVLGIFKFKLLISELSCFQKASRLTSLFETLCQLTHLCLTFLFQNFYVFNNLLWSCFEINKSVWDIVSVNTSLFQSLSKTITPAWFEDSLDLPYPFLGIATSSALCGGHLKVSSLKQDDLNFTGAYQTAFAAVIWL